MSRQQHAPETRAAVLAACLAGQGADQVAKEFAIPASTVRSWVRRYRRGELVDDPSARAEVGDLLLDYLRANLETLQLQVATTLRDPTWLAKQSASEVGVLHGILADKAVRLLEALAAGAEAEPVAP